MIHTPKARRDGLIVRELEDETLIYDVERDEAHCLNQTAALVWKHCDGCSTVPQIAARVAKELHAPVDAQVVWLALSQLRRKRLLTERILRERSSSRISRREMALRLAQGAALALPFITTIAAPRPASAGSLDCSNCGPPTALCCPNGCPCQTGASCCTGFCGPGVCANPPLN